MSIPIKVLAISGSDSFPNSLIAKILTSTVSPILTTSLNSNAAACLLGHLKVYSLLVLIFFIDILWQTEPFPG